MVPNEKNIASCAISPRIALGSLLGFWCGEFSNSFVLSRMKIWTEGRHLWARTIGSTLIGELFDSALFYPVAFLGIWNTDLLVKVAISNYALKVAWEVIATPLTYLIIGRLKTAEAMDTFDQSVDYNPFKQLFQS
ncbi:MAG: VUT family protein [Proteobacteria bacterium]|nr:MAG: VUT family protein [Pseudomonadota bacterium]